MNKITNLSGGARGVHTSRGLVLLEPGETRSLDIIPESLPRLRSNADFGFGETGEKDAAKADRAETIREAITALSAGDYTAAGKPQVDAINDAMPDGAEPVTAAERDAVWDDMQ